jgi:hypothetical protein
MRRLPDDAYSMIAFLVLMTGGRGLLDKAPEYIQEKAWAARSRGLDAFAMLDIYNMRRFMEYCKVWKVEVPKEIQERYDAEEGAAKELAAKGIEL